MESRVAAPRAQFIKAADYLPLIHPDDADFTARFTALHGRQPTLSPATGSCGLGAGPGLYAGGVSIGVVMVGVAKGGFLSSLFAFHSPKLSAETVSILESNGCDFQLFNCRSRRRASLNVSNCS